MLLSKAADGFILDGKIALKGDKTLRDYTWHLHRFILFEGDVDVERVTVEDVRAYIAQQRERGLKDHSVWGYYRYLKAFFRWCQREGIVARDLFATIPAPRLPQILPKVLTVEQVEQLFKQLKRDPSPRGKRNLVIFATFLDCGLRVNELANLKLNDVALGELYLMITRGKWKKQRPVPISPTLKRLLWRYINDWREKLRPKCDMLFVNHEGYPLVTTGMQIMVRRSLSQVGVQGGPHMLRHTFATLYLRNGGSLEHLRLILGHVDLSTTQRYVHLVAGDLVDRHPEASPLQRLRL